MWARGTSPLRFDLIVVSRLVCMSAEQFRSERPPAPKTSVYSINYKRKKSGKESHPRRVGQKLHAIANNH